MIDWKYSTVCISMEQAVNRAVLLVEFIFVFNVNITVFLIFMHYLEDDVEFLHHVKKR